MDKEFGIIALTTLDHELSVEACCAGSSWQLMGFFYVHHGEYRYLVGTPFFRPLPKWIIPCRTVNDLICHSMVTGFSMRSIIMSEEHAPRIRKQFDFLLASRVQTFTRSNPRLFWDNVFAPTYSYPMIPVVGEIISITNALFQFIKEQDGLTQHVQDLNMHGLMEREHDLLTPQRTTFNYYELNISRQALREMPETVRSMDKFAPQGRMSSNSIELIEKLVQIARDRCSKYKDGLQCITHVLTQGRGMGYE